MYKSLGKRIKELRQEKGLTQGELSRLINISRSNIGKIENDQISPSADAVVKIASFFKTSTDWILTGKNELNNDSSLKNEDEFFDDEIVDADYREVDPSIHDKSAVKEESPSYGFSKEELEIIKLYRKLDTFKKGQVYGVLITLVGKDELSATQEMEHYHNQNLLSG